MQPRRNIFAAAVLVVALTAARGQADLIAWSYQWNAQPIVVNADPLGPNRPPTGGITLTPAAITVTGGAPGTAQGNADLVAVFLNTFNFSPNPDGQPNRFTNSPYNLKVTLTDSASHASADLRFPAVFNGTLTDSTANIHTSFTAPTRQRVVLGENLYTVTLTTYRPPGPPTSVGDGQIDAHVEVRPVGAPEPSGLVLACAGLAGIVGLALRRAAGIRIA
jgi:hypothetical protein